MPAKGCGKIQRGTQEQKVSVAAYITKDVETDVEVGVTTTGKSKNFLMGEAIRLGLKAAIKKHTPKS